MGEQPVSEDPIGKRVAENIRHERLSRGMTLKDVETATRAAGRPISVSMVSKIETHARRVDVDDLVVLAWVLGVEPHALLFRTREHEPTVSISADVHLAPSVLRGWLSPTLQPGSPSSLRELVREVVEEVLTERTREPLTGSRAGNADDAPSPP